MVPPIYQSSVFPIDTLEETDDIFEGIKGDYFYSRDGNPTSDVFGESVASLEGAEAGAASSSGMGATLATLLVAMESGTHLVAARNLYGKATVLLKSLAPVLGNNIEFVEATDTKAWEKAISKSTSAIFLETETNPLLRIPDLPKIADLAKQSASTFIVDNTFASPFHISPLNFGADMVIHSATKFLSGHGDVTAGVVVGSRDWISRVKSKISLVGVNLAPFEAWLALRGSKTLAVRLAKSSANAMKIAQYLNTHPKVTEAYYPGLDSHPDHETALKIMQNGFGSMISFEIDGGIEKVGVLFKELQQIRYAPSLGDVNTTITHPAKTSHRGISQSERTLQGIQDGLIRLSVGIENVSDIITDIECALRKI
ncbi:MAG: cystathionine gamma-synthase/methionine-gamma-lyase [Chloroflexi bacterium]|jgi:cystathionine beta-lyase/cystathionine gamma-synthase|nr:MAG: cystathionine gamma-synthase/methionine-gamma-lyase [Chloroflexota bacterium]